MPAKRSHFWDSWQKFDKKDRKLIMLKSIRLWMIGCLIESEWHRIAAWRRKAFRLIDAGTPWMSPELVELSDRIARSGFRSWRLEQRYRVLAGL